jgi:citrate synthase
MGATTTQEQYENYSPGLQGVVAGISKIAEIDSDRSSLTYRGIDVHELAEHASFEETSYLLLHYTLPNKQELQQFKDRTSKMRQIPDRVIDALKLVSPEAHPMDMMRIGFDVAAGYDPDYTDDSHESNLRKAERIMAMAPTILAAGHRIRRGYDPVAPDPKLSHAGNFLYMLFGEAPDELTERAMDASLTLYAEHTFNASAFACRVTVSTLSDLYSGIISGIGTLKGPLHGGANEMAMRMMLEVGTPEHAESWARDALAQKKKIMGFGHREYKKRDSRAIYLGKLAREIGEQKGETKWNEIADTLEDVVLEEKGIYPNVDFPTAFLYYLLNIPIELYTPIFVVARVVGWSSHAIEQLDNNRLIRPTQIYEGRRNVAFRKLEDR